MSMHWPVARFFGLALAVGLTYAYIGYWLYVRWSGPDSYFHHGFLIPLFFLWMLWRRRARLRSVRHEPDYRGLLLVVPALSLHLLAVYMELYSPSGFTLPVLFGGMILYFFGWEVLKILLFPLLYLYFAIPPPMTMINALSFRLKIIAMGVANSLNRLLGIEVREEGSYLHFSNGDSLLVDAPCSGLRSLIALLAIGVLYCFEFVPLSRLGKAVFIVMMIPVAMASNVLRISFLCIVTHCWNADTASGLIHDLSGYAVYGVALLMMIALGRLLRLMPLFAGRPPCEAA